MSQKTNAEFTRIEDMTSIFDCAEYLEHGHPPYHDNYDVRAGVSLPIVFSFAYTPRGRVSRYWCSLSFRHDPSAEEVENWMAARPRLRKGYKWSKPYWYAKRLRWDR